ncbi:hypothetical protein DM02DRAFT_365366 [Periconia macrospinosa]|uniref:Uncharacterized protein n=1 Tax=Periconia macrospinosa TaxID=97972 RepID=A0A2V1DWC3_9PLEO|nr:hypothetical protein DM02DRAFT_365366 [Periconia macrospinosa]
MPGGGGWAGSAASWRPTQGPGGPAFDRPAATPRRPRRGALHRRGERPAPLRKPRQRTLGRSLAPAASVLRDRPLPLPRGPSPRPAPVPALSPAAAPADARRSTFTPIGSTPPQNQPTTESTHHRIDYITESTTSQNRLHHRIDYTTESTHHRIDYTHFFYSDICGRCQTQAKTTKIRLHDERGGPPTSPTIAPANHTHSSPTRTSEHLKPGETVTLCMAAASGPNWRHVCRCLSIARCHQQTCLASFHCPLQEGRASETPFFYGTTHSIHVRVYVGCMVID